jgi:predicted nucleic acid-binding protein
MPSRFADVPARIVVDAGPFIAHIREDDPDHSTAVRGFEALARMKSHLIVPAPIVLEVFKWTLHHGGPAAARSVLARMRGGCEVLPLDRRMFEAACALVDHLPGWEGTLEDATVAVSAMELGVPVWTLNYRDFAAFPRVGLWNPPTG